MGRNSVSEVESMRRELARLKHGAINQDFVQVSRKHIDALNELAMLSPKAHYLLWCLVKAMDKQNALLTSQESLIKITNLTRPTLQRAISLLREQRWIEVLKVGTTNVYRVNSSVFWKARADGKWASFSAEVLINFDEQDEITKADPSPKLREVPLLRSNEDVVVTGAQLGSDDPPEQAQIDFHKEAE